MRFIFREFGIRLMASVCLVVTGRGGSQKFRYERGRTRTKIAYGYVLSLESAKAVAGSYPYLACKKTELSANICLS